MRKHAARLFALITLAVSSVVAALFVAAPTIALTHYLGYWSYPAFFLAGLGLSGIVLGVLIPAERTSEVTWPWLQKKLVVNENRFEKGLWPWIQRRGDFIFVLVVTFWLGPFISAIAIRLIGVPEDRVWPYAVITNAISISIWISIYLGCLDTLRGLF